MPLILAFNVAEVGCLRGIFRFQQVDVQLDSSHPLTQFCQMNGTRSGPKLAQGFGYERVTIKQTRVFFRYFMCLTFSNKPSPVNQTCSKPTSLKGQAVHVGIDEDGEDYHLDTAGHSGMIVAGLPGSGKTIFLRRLAKTFALNPANHIIVFDGKGTRDFEDLAADTSQFSLVPQIRTKKSTINFPIWSRNSKHGRARALFLVVSLL